MLKFLKLHLTRLYTCWEPNQFGVGIIFLAIIAPGIGAPVQAVPGVHAGCKGRIVHVSTGEEVDFPTIASELAEADFVLFGERHGVREHAQASACVLNAMAADDRRVALVMEMLSRDDQRVIDTWRRVHPENAAGLGARLQWWKRGWPAFNNWLPLLDRAFGLRIPLFGGDLPAGASGPRAMTSEERTMMARHLGDAAGAIESSWQAAMFAAHCELVAADEASRLAQHQVRRDLSMAEVARTAWRNSQAVLIQTGRGHSRKDRSLHRALHHGLAVSVVSIGAFTEGEKILASDRDAHDFLWIIGTDESAHDGCYAALGEVAGEAVQEKHP